MNKQPIRIILVDDHRFIRESWRFLLEKDDRFLIVGECADGREAIEQAQLLQPDVMLMDINMRHINGFEATKVITVQSPDIRIIGLSVNNHPGYAHKMIRLGAKGFVTKSSPFSELVDAILKVHAGEAYICDEIVNESSSGQR